MSDSTNTNIGQMPYRQAAISCGKWVVFGLVLVALFLSAIAAASSLPKLIIIIFSAIGFIFTLGHQVFGGIALTYLGLGLGSWAFCVNQSASPSDGFLRNKTSKRIAISSLFFSATALISSLSTVWLTHNIPIANYQDWAIGLGALFAGLSCFCSFMGVLVEFDAQ